MSKRIPSGFSPTFSDAVVVESGDIETIYVSGQVGMDGSGKIVVKSFDDEVRVCFENLQNALHKAGASMKDVVRITAFLTDLSDYPSYSRARGLAFPSDPPASATVQVAGLLIGARVEVDAIATRKKD